MIAVKSFVLIAEFLHFFQLAHRFDMIMKSRLYDNCLKQVTCHDHALPYYHCFLILPDGSKGVMFAAGT